LGIFLSDRRTVGRHDYHSICSSVLSFREHGPCGTHNDFKHIAFWFYNQNPRVLQLCAPFVRLARQPFLIDMLRVPHHHVHGDAKLRRDFLMRESVKTPSRGEPARFHDRCGNAGAHRPERFLRLTQRRPKGAVRRRNSSTAAGPRSPGSAIGSVAPGPLPAGDGRSRGGDREALRASRKPLKDTDRDFLCRCCYRLAYTCRRKPRRPSDIDDGPSFGVNRLVVRTAAGGPRALSVAGRPLAARQVALPHKGTCVPCCLW
jgi:hypothetical protein